MDHFDFFYTARPVDRASGAVDPIEFEDSDPASAIGMAIRAFGPGQFQLACGDGRNWRVHVASDHSWWLEPFGRL